MSEQAPPILTFRSEGKEVAVHLDSPENTVWATANGIADLFGCTTRNVEMHIKNVYRDGEVDEFGTTKTLFEVRREGERAVERAVVHYSLDVILAVGYRISGKRATGFRRWASERLKEYLVRGYAVNEERLKDDPAALKALAAKLRSIRTGEKAMYEKVREVFKHSSADYDVESHAARTFFAIAQDKFHYAVTGKTAADIVLERADASKENIGLVTFSGKQPCLDDARVGKNYLNEDELRALENISEQFLLFAESKAFRGQKMTMEELSFKLNTLLTANDYPVLYQYDGYRRKAANEHAKQALGEWKSRQVGQQRQRGVEGRKRIESIKDSARKRRGPN